MNEEVTLNANLSLLSYYVMFHYLYQIIKSTVSIEQNSMHIVII